MFVVGGSYANRIGKYTVLAITGPRMTVRYDTGATAELNMDIQRRIWENIVAEEEARSASRAARASRARTTAQNAQFFVKPISTLAAEELTFPGWQERVAALGEANQEIKAGDRLIYYAIEPQVFFAVATITGVSFEAGSSNTEGEQVRYFPVDLDAYANNLDRAVPLDSVELENVPNLRELLKRPDTYIRISEDDFELLAELLTEVTEEEDEEEEEEEEEEEDEE
jgi:hypothetical protein